MSITKRNHINPCFWSALWNKEYYSKFQSNSHITDKARDQLLNFLETKSNKHLIDKAENIHYEKKLGIAEMKPDKVREFCKKYFPEHYDSFLKETESQQETLYLDFENHFTIMETLPTYQVMLKTIQAGKVQHFEDKVWLTTFLLNHKLRSHITLNSMTELYSKLGVEKFELLWLLKWSLANPNFHFEETAKISHSTWTIYVTKKPIFPLSDNPIVITKKNIVATLSPFMVLYVDRNFNGDTSVRFRNGISWIRFWRYKKLTISNTIKGLIFYDSRQLASWKASFWWKQRRKFLSDKKNFNKLIAKDGLRELWQIDSLSNRLK